MRTIGVTIILVALLGGAILAAPVADPAAPAYPEARRGEHVDQYHGQPVADPYRWMEQEDSPDVRSWITAQERLFDDFVRPHGVAKLAEQIRGIRDFDSASIPVRRGSSYFHTETKAGKKHGKLYVRQGLAGKPRLLVDFAKALGDPSHRSGGFIPSPDGRHVVWGSSAPAGWGWLEITGIDGKQRTAERIKGLRSTSALWTADSEGFFYISYGDYDALVAGSAEARPELRYHRLGSSPAEDRLVYGREDRPGLLFTAKLSDKKRYLVLELYDGTGKENQVIYQDLRKPDQGFVELIGTADAGYSFEGNVGRRFIFLTTLDAPRGRLIALDLDDPAREQWKEILPQREQALTAVSHIGGRLVVQSTVHARPVVEVFRTDGRREREVKLPGIGGVFGFNDDPASSTAFYGFNTLYDPGTIYEVDLTTGKSKIHHRPKLTYDPDDFEIRQVFYNSKDGTRVPMFVAHKRGMKLDGSHPAFMYGYGHGGWVAFPWFQPHLVAWLQLGGVYALPGLRGGGEYGAEWQAAGTRRNKQNTIDDFIAATEWLIANGYTSASKMVANGGSASGVLAAAAVVQRPELYGAALVEWPFLDMLRYHEFTWIKGWTSGYGSSSDAEDFAVLRGYSPLHNINKDACYPPMLTVVGEEDRSTAPMHGYKFTAELQGLRGCSAPFLLKFIPEGGHYSYGRTPEASVETQAEVLAFLIRVLGLGGR